MSELRQRILTEREKKILKTYVEEGVKLDGFSVLILRSQRNEAKLKGELELIEAALRKFKGSKKRENR